VETTESPASLDSTPIVNPVSSETSDPFANPRLLIDAREPLFKINLRELWSYRELLFFLTWRDIKIRYKQTALGALWAIIQPLFAMILFTVVFGLLARVPSDNVPYPLFAYAGLVPWTFFANAITNSGNSLVGSSTLISKVYFPRLFIPAAAVASGLLDLAIASLLLIPLLIYFQITLTWKILFLPVIAGLVAVLALGVGMVLSALNVKYRDVRYALPFLVQLWLFASPVIYPTSLVPANWRWLLSVNPMTGLIEAFRASLFGHDFEPSTLLPAVVITILVLVLSFFAFRRVEDSFADIV
jgi:lipopolysaccharide transport system permease protein